jgi:hypothetical protein
MIIYLYWFGLLVRFINELICLFLQLICGDINDATDTFADTTHDTTSDTSSDTSSDTTSDTISDTVTADHCGCS